MREEVLALIIEEGSKLWDRTDLTEDTTFAEVNAKSVHKTTITVALENEFECEVPFLGFNKCATLGEAADYVVELIEE